MCVWVCVCVFIMDTEYEHFQEILILLQAIAQTIDSTPRTQTSLSKAMKSQSWVTKMNIPYLVSAPLLPHFLWQIFLPVH